MNTARCIAFGALWTAAGVVLGAFGAHALNERLVASDSLANWKTAVEYQVWHGLALILYGLFCRSAHGACGAFAAWAFGIGSLLFSGSLYGLCLDGPGAILGPLTPLGGAALIAGWAAFARAALRSGSGDG